ncbi:hypothetical protein [Flavobacterium sp. B183]|uniref:hypothetical protein n=1 Tax=Flavobacterium sp. B183 TaxID=907046 RepID=UPI00201F5532|nr:hypothetical protein [Flavobacterium sp. B183]URC11027.1 hypothetical protein M4I44_13080 [Flavobacterium sp. B183]
MKKEHKLILNLIESYLEKNPSQRFGQALFNLGINEFKETTDPRNPNYNIRDIHGDDDLKIIERVENRLAYFESRKNKI